MFVPIFAHQGGRGSSRWRSGSAHRGRSPTRRDYARPRQWLGLACGGSWPKCRASSSQHHDLTQPKIALDSSSPIVEYLLHCARRIQ
jgi:hypothetical protein